jgi:glycosyltransferase involved in cell wall biosynthesis
MNVVFAIKRLERAAGGSERVLAWIASALARRGENVTVLTWDAPGTSPFYAFDPAVRIVNRGVGDTSRNAGVAETFARIADLRTTVRALQPDVAIGFGHSMFVPLAIALVGTGIPVVGSEHAAMPHYQGRRIQYALLRLSARKLTKITVMSDSIMKDYTPDVRAKMIVVSNPIMVDENIEQPSDARNTIVLSVGRLEEQKDHATLVRAFAQIAAEFPAWTLQIIGEGSLRRSLEDLTRSLGMQDRIAMPGLTTTIGDAYRSAGLFALSSRYESQGLVSLEAMAHGLAVVGFSNCPGTNEIVDDGVNGLLVDGTKDRVAALAAGLRQLISRPELRERLGEGGRLTVGRMLRESHVIEDWTRLLQHVAGTKDHRAG